MKTLWFLHHENKILQIDEVAHNKKSCEEGIAFNQLRGRGQPTEFYFFFGDNVLVHIITRRLVQVEDILILDLPKKAGVLGNEVGNHLESLQGRLYVQHACDSVASEDVSELHDERQLSFSIITW